MSERDSEIREPNAAFAIAFHCHQRRPLLSSDRWMSVLSEIAANALHRHHLALYAYVFLPTTARLLVSVRETATVLPRMLYSMKRTFTERVKPELRRVNRALWSELVARERGGRYVFRFWEPGPGIIERLVSSSAIVQAIEDIHAAPARAGLCDEAGEWRWSSWGQYHAGSDWVSDAVLAVHADALEVFASSGL